MVHLSIDYGDDGVNERRTAYYDEFSRKVNEESDSDNDGVIDGAQVWNYDGLGHLISVVADDDNDGSVDSRWMMEYDSCGRRTAQTVDVGADGFADIVTRWDYGPLGRVVRMEKDRDGDGRLDDVVAYGYGVDGRLASELDDPDNDGRATITTRYRWSERRLISVTIDFASDGRIESRRSHSYDARGWLRRTSYDDNNDGVDDQVEEIDYDGMPWPVASRWYARGFLEASGETEYDDVGRLVLERGESLGERSSHRYVNDCPVRVLR